MSGLDKINSNSEKLSFLSDFQEALHTLRKSSVLVCSRLAGLGKVITLELISAALGTMKRNRDAFVI